MSSYQEMIIEDTRCSRDDAVMIENIMRDHVFHSTLDWQSRAELRRAAREAARILAESRPLFEKYFTRTREHFHKMRAENEARAKIHRI